MQRVTHCPKEGPGCGLSLLEQRVGRSLPGPTRYILPCPLQRFFFLSLSRSLPNANIVSENCTKARHVWSVNFCHHKSISHARGGGSFRRRGGQGAVHLETVTSNERNENPEILNICTQTYVSFDITLFRCEFRCFLFLSFSVRGDEGDRVSRTRKTSVFITSNALPRFSWPDPWRFRRLPSSVVPLNRASKSSSSTTRITQIIVFVPRKRPPKRKTCP